MRKRSIVLLSVLGLLLLVGLSLTLLIWTGWLGERLRTFTIHQLEGLTGWDFEIEGLTGNLITGIVAEGVRITRPEEAELLVQTGQITFKYDILDLILGSKDVKQVTITAPFVNLRADWSLPEKETPSGENSGIPDFSIRSLKIETGRIVGIPELDQADSIDLHLSVSGKENRIDFTIIHCAMRLKELGIKTIVSQGVFEKELLKLKKFQLATEKSTISLKGIIGVKSTHLSGETNFELEELTKLFTLRLLSGKLRSSFSMRMAKGSGSIDGNIVLHRGKIDRYVLGNLEGSFFSDFNRVMVNVNRWSIGDGEAAGSVEFDLRSSAVKARMAGTQFDLSQISDQLSNLSSSINFEAVVDLATVAPDLRGTADLSLTESTIRGFYTDQLSAKINIENGFWEIEQLNLTSGTSSAIASGKIFQSAIDLSVETKGVELSQLSDILGVENLSGRLYADLLIQGNPRKPFIIGSFWTRELSLPHTEFEYLNGHLSFQYSKENPRIDLQVHITEGTVFNRELSDFNLNINGEGRIFCYSADFGVEASSIQLAGEIRSSHGETKVVNQHLTFSSNGQSVTTLDDLVLVLTPETRLENTRFSVCEGCVELSGNYSSPNLIEIVLVGEHINLEDVAELTGMKQVLRGHLNLSLQLNGPFIHPEFNLEAEIDSFSYEYANLKLVEIEANYENGSLNLARFNLRGDRGEYSMEGYVPVDLSLGKPAFIQKEMDLNVDLHGLDPWMFQSIDPYVELKECKLDADLHIYGTPLDPRISGALTLQKGQFYSRLLKTFITELEAKAEFEDKDIRISSLSARTEEGTLNARGVLHLENLIPETVDIEVDLVELPVRGIEDVYALIEGNLRIRGDAHEPSIDGDIRIDELLVTMPFQQKAGPRTKRKPLQFQCNVSVDADRSIWVRNQNANIQLDGELNVKVKEGILFLSGELNTMRGWVSYYEREFRIVKGRFKFTDIPEINPELDILAEAEVTYTSVDNDVRSSKRDVIRVQITGTMQTPEVVLSSESGELSELDIFSLLTLNMTWDELGSDERMDMLREQAAERVLDLAASQITQQIRQAVGLDALKIKVQPIGEEAGAKLTVGKYVSRDLYVSYTSELFSAVKDQFRVEYFVGRRGAIVGERNEEGRYFIGLNYKLRF